MKTCEKDNEHLRLEHDSILFVVVTEEPLFKFYHYKFR